MLYVRNLWRQSRNIQLKIEIDSDSFKFRSTEFNLIAGRHGQVLATACTGSGAPTHALQQLVGKENINERIASEKHVSRLERL